MAKKPSKTASKKPSKKETSKQDKNKKLQESWKEWAAKNFPNTYNAMVVTFKDGREWTIPVPDFYEIPEMRMGEMFCFKRDGTGMRGATDKHGDFSFNPSEVTCVYTKRLPIQKDDMPSKDNDKSKNGDTEKKTSEKQDKLVDKEVETSDKLKKKFWERFIW